MNKCQFKIKLNLMHLQKRMQALELNLSKAYSLTRDQCAKSLQNKIEARTDYPSFIKGNTINL
jgi:D-alanine-D-alanine ligase-like ATP-grasp enzyme